MITTRPAIHPKPARPLEAEISTLECVCVSCKKPFICDVHTEGYQVLRTALADKKHGGDWRPSHCNRCYDFAVTRRYQLRTLDTVLAQWQTVQGTEDSAELTEPTRAKVEALLQDLCTITAAQYGTRSSYDQQFTRMLLSAPAQRRETLEEIEHAITQRAQLARGLGMGV